MYSNISQILLLYKTWQYYNKFDSTKSVGVHYRCVKIPQCGYMEHGLKDIIGLQYQVFLNFYVIYRSTVICKLTLHIFGNLIAHWLLASLGSFTPDARVSLWIFFVLEWVLNGCMWLLAQGTPQWRIKHRNGQEDSLIYIIPTRRFLLSNNIAFYVQ